MLLAAVRVLETGINWDQLGSTGMPPEATVLTACLIHDDSTHQEQASSPSAACLEWTRLFAPGGWSEARSVKREAVLRALLTIKAVSASAGLAGRLRRPSSSKLESHSPLAAA
jgi:hypothetical protein